MSAADGRRCADPRRRACSAPGSQAGEQLFESAGAGSIERVLSRGYAPLRVAAREQEPAPAPGAGRETTADLGITARRGEGCTVVAVRGECDVLTAPVLRERLLELAGQSATLVVDLSGLRFLDCAGLGALLAGRRRAELLGGTLVITAPSPPVARLLQLTGLSRRLKVVPRPETAPAATGSAEPAPQAGEPRLASSAVRGGAPGTAPARGPRLPPSDAAGQGAPPAAADSAGLACPPARQHG